MKITNKSYKKGGDVVITKLTIKWQSIISTIPSLYNNKKVTPLFKIIIQFFFNYLGWLKI